MPDEQLQSVIEALEELRDDTTVQRNIKNKISQTIQTLSENEELSIRINKALDELDEISNDNNLHSYTRTQIWNIVSMLEMIQS
ncbi:MAG: UPF0147 family protein [Candidatus Nanoarchaeia archaeon]